MAKILFTWELGAGIGHIMPIQRLLLELHKQHECYAIVQDLSLAETILAGLNVTLLAAPAISTSNQSDIDALCFSDLLYNSGYSDPVALSNSIEQWQQLFKQLRPDLVLFDHSPTALAASQGCSFTRLVYGSGFICPPASSPCGVFFPGNTTEDDNLRMQNTEATVLGNINSALAALTKPLIKQVSDLYYNQNRLLLTTLPAFDHYASNRHNQPSYAGITAAKNAKKPCWPHSTGKRIFAYLKPSQGLPELLRALQQSRQSVIIYSNNINPDGLAHFASPTMRFENEALDLSMVASECDFAIVNGGHDTSVELLLRGLPLVIIPLQKEQQIFSLCAEKSGAVLSIQPGQHYNERIIDALNEMASNSRYKRAAHALSNTCSDSQPFACTKEQVRVINSLLKNNSNHL